MLLLVTVILVIVTLISVVWAFADWVDRGNRKFFIIPVFLVAVIVGIFKSESFRTEVQQINAKEEQNRLARTKPYLISKMDNGCEVYEFFGYNDGDVHHFVKCPNSPQTDVR